MCNVDIRKNLYANAVSPGGTAFFKGTGECMFQELTALALFSMKFMWLLHLSESTQYGLECRGWPTESTTLFPDLHAVRRWHPQEFVRRVVLSGGTTILQGIGEHMTNELTEKTRVLQDENIVTVGTERFRCVETLFQPVCSPRVPRHFFAVHHEVTSISAESHTPVSCCQAARPVPRKFFELTKEMTALFHPRRRSRRLHRFGMGLEDQSLFPSQMSFFSQLHNVRTIEVRRSSIPNVSFRSSSKKKKRLYKLMSRT